MSFGKMNTQIQITQKQITLDDEGFQTESNVGQTEPLFPKLPTCSVFAPFRE